MSEARLLTLVKARTGEIVGEAVVDAADYTHLAQWNWYVSDSGYAMRATTIRENGRPKFLAIRMHRYLMGLEPGDGLEVDHINGDKLDNRRSNLRVCSHAENHQNRTAVATSSTSRHRGVCWSKAKRKWRAEAGVSGRNVHIGYFEDEDEAGEAARVWRDQHMPYASR